MKIVCIAASAEQRKELEENVAACSNHIQWVVNTANLWKAKADFLIDCTFTGSIVPLIDKPLLIHSPVRTLTNLQVTGNVARFCGWNTFLRRSVWDIAVADNTSHSEWVKELMHLLDRKCIIVKDSSGLVSARIVTAMLYEASKTFASGVSTMSEIDLAMQLGTNYPYGPLEWMHKIGIEQVQSLADIMFSSDPHLSH